MEERFTPPEHNKIYEGTGGGGHKRNAEPQLLNPMRQRWKGARQVGEGAGGGRVGDIAHPPFFVKRTTATLLLSPTPPHTPPPPLSPHNLSGVRSVKEGVERESRRKVMARRREEEGVQRPPPPTNWCTPQNTQALSKQVVFPLHPPTSIHRSSCDPYISITQ